MNRPGLIFRFHSTRNVFQLVYKRRIMPKGNRSGVKQRVLKQTVSSSKRKDFKGIPKHRKIAENAAKRPRVEITFVGEDDVVSEQIPEPVASVSSRKLQESDNESASDESISPEMPVAEGYRFVAHGKPSRVCGENSFSQPRLCIR